MTDIFVARSDRLAARKVAGEVVILSADDSSLYVLNGVGSAVWEAADGRTPLSTIVDDIICRGTTSIARARGATSRSSWQGLCVRRAADISGSHVHRSARSSSIGGHLMPDLMQYVWDRALDSHVPLSVHFDLTYRCNERCVHCYLDHDDHGEMTTPEVTDVLDQLAAAGTLVPDVQRRRNPAAQGSVRTGRVRSRAAVRRQAQDKRASSSARARPRASASSACASCRSASTPTARTCMTRSRRFLARSHDRWRRSDSLSAQGCTGHDRECADAAERVRLPGRACAGDRAGRRLHDRPDHYAEDGWRHVDRRSAAAGATVAPRLYRSIACWRRFHDGAVDGDRPRDARRASVQCRAHILLHLSLRGRVPLRPVPAPKRQPAPAAFRADLVRVTATRAMCDPYGYAISRPVRVAVTSRRCTRCPGLAYMEGNMRGPSSADCEKSLLRTGAAPRSLVSIPDAAQGAPE